MVNRPSVPEIITVNSEALQTTIRDLLPSQNGFGSELQASNVITPIIDLTTAAEGSSIPVSMQQALAFGSQTSFDVNNTTTSLISSPGFYRIIGSVTVQKNASAPRASFSMSDGVTDKEIFAWQQAGSGSTRTLMNSYDFIVFLRAGDSLSAISNSTPVFLAGSTRQIADGSGTLVNPTGFPL